MTKKTIQLGMFGLGVVGSGVVEILNNNLPLLEKRLGASLKLKHVVCAHPNKRRSISVKGVSLSSEPADILQDAEIDLVIEVMGGISPAKEVVLEAMEQGKAVVTANKALLAECGADIFGKAQRSNVALGMEAAVAGGIPILRSLRDGLAANHIQEIFGIINGTSNYILSCMTQRPGSEFNAILAEAQQKGYAEADPTFDIGGHDAAHKLTILINLAFGTIVNYSDIPKEGIEHITPLDIQYAQQMGCVIKLLAIARPQQNTHEGIPQIEARVHPTLIPQQHPLASVNEAFNAVFVTGDQVGPAISYGQGAGAAPTGSAIVSDVMEISRCLLHQTAKFAPPLGVEAAHLQQFHIQPIQHTQSHYYFRFQVLDQVGVLAQITNIMGKNNISIQSVLQPSQAEHPQQPVQVILTTHRALEKNIQTSLQQIQSLPFIAGPTQLLRMENF